MKSRSTRNLAGSAIAVMVTIGALSLAITPAGAQGFPNKPITVVVPFAAGSGTDIGCRMFNDAAQPSLKQPMIVENRPGGAAIVGVSHVAKAAPDGYTLLCLGGGSVSRTFMKNADANVVNDLTPVVQITSGAMFLITRGDVRSTKDFIELVRKNPGKYNYGYIASTQMMPMEVLKDKERLNMVGVPYKGLAAVIQAFTTGDIVAYVSNRTGLESLFDAGKLRFVAVLGENRNPLFPDVPTAAEAGIPGVRAPFSQGFWAPAGTPPAVVSQLNAAYNTGLRTPAVVEFLKKNGTVPVGGAPNVQADFVRAEHAYWAEAARIAKFEPQ